jgi:DNA-binding MarR family transcriptional regulator
LRTQVSRLVKQGCDLSLRQLFILFECMDRGQVTVKSLHESGGGHMDKPAVSRGVQRLKDLGYVDRIEHPEDRRSVLVSLTPAGRTFIRAALKD